MKRQKSRWELEIESKDRIFWIISFFAILIGFFIVIVMNNNIQSENTALKAQIGNTQNNFTVDFWCHKNNTKIYMSYSFQSKEVSDIFVNVVMSKTDLNCEVLK